jgi:hypothetical protein
MVVAKPIGVAATTTFFIHFVNTVVRPSAILFQLGKRLRVSGKVDLIHHTLHSQFFHGLQKLIIHMHFPRRRQ